MPPAVPPPKLLFPYGLAERLGANFPVESLARGGSRCTACRGLGMATLRNRCATDDRSRGRYPSSVCLTLRARSWRRNGFDRKFTSLSSLPWWTMEFSV